jgi:hypothetical protein
MRGCPAALAFLSFLVWSTARGATVQLDAAGQPLPCQQLEGGDAATLACLQQQPPETAVHIRTLLEACMLRGQWKSSAHLVALSKKKALDVANTVSSVSTQIRRELQTLSDSISSPVTEGIAPAYECVAFLPLPPALLASCPPPPLFSPSLSSPSHAQPALCAFPLFHAPARRWAQSVEQVYLQVKWAHKLDAPATLGCEPSAPIFTERLVTFGAECKEKRKAFALQLPLWGGLDIASCSWGNASVGRAFVTLQKGAAGPWPRLLSGASRPANQHIWWSMKESHADDLEKWVSPTPKPPGGGAPPPPPPPPPPPAPSAASEAASGSGGAAAAAPEEEQAKLPPLRSLS